MLKGIDFIGNAKGILGRGLPRNEKFIFKITSWASREVIYSFTTRIPTCLLFTGS